MAQPNLAREPSMDEILASIRRIIESNEPVPQAGMATSTAEPEGFMGRPANDDSEEVTLTVDDAFAAEDDDYRQPEPPIAAPSPMSVHAAQALSMMHPDTVRRDEPATLPQKSLSLADVAARVRAAAERGQAERSASLQDEPRKPAAIEPLAQKVESAERFDSAMHRDAPESSEPVFERPHGQSYQAAEIDVEPSVQPMALLSSSVGEQVARSFQDLAFAVDDAERRSLDQVAEDMLRPMLQEWLDDNLPTLVERLVREEIERVARGPRR